MAARVTQAAAVFVGAVAIALTTPGVQRAPTSGKPIVGALALGLVLQVAILVTASIVDRKSFFGSLA